MSDAVNHPAHYNAHPAGVECIDVIEWMPANCANAFKYLWRCDLKHPAPDEDLRKAIWYLEREAARPIAPAHVMLIGAGFSDAMRRKGLDRNEVTDAFPHRIGRAMRLIWDYCVRDEGDLGEAVIWIDSERQHRAENAKA